MGRGQFGYKWVCCSPSDRSVLLLVALAYSFPMALPFSLFLFLFSSGSPVVRVTKYSLVPLSLLPAAPRHWENRFGLPHLPGFAFLSTPCGEIRGNRTLPGTFLDSVHPVTVRIVLPLSSSCYEIPSRPLAIFH